MLVPTGAGVDQQADTSGQLRKAGMHAGAGLLRVFEGLGLMVFEVFFEGLGVRV